MKVCVLGAGIIGTSSAVRILETVPGVKVTIVSELFTPDTTGDGAAGLWQPYLLNFTSDESVLKQILQDTFDFLENLYHTDEGGIIGIQQTSAYGVTSDNVAPEPIYKDIVYGYRYLTDEEMKRFDSKFKHGWSFTTFITECTKFIPYLLKRFKDKGGKIEKRKVNNLQELAGDYDVIVNCTGVQAHHVTPDPTVYPIRGQVMRVKAPWVKMIYNDESDDGNYIIPNSETVVLGGTHQEGDWNRNVDPRDSKAIWEGCVKLLPSLKHAVILKEWVGLRPGRNTVRLDDEVISVGNKDVTVIHNYGHGGSGVTVFWGCAKQVGDLVLKAAATRNKPTSRL